MKKKRLILRRRDFISAGILGSAGLSIFIGRLFFSTGVPSSLGKDIQIKSKRTDHTQVYDIVEKYGAEFGAIKPVIRRHRNGRL
ncbi:MAG: hypothetical protein KAT01_09400 [Candidatus Aminicenantes bacterium]|jgi:hypothetical protein|nr:hypothetical protein [Candidatus Aminicenantes bacterium]